MPEEEICRLFWSHRQAKLLGYERADAIAAACPARPDPRCIGRG
jgi:hypothetical protein